MALLVAISPAVGNALGETCQFPLWLREGAPVIFDPAVHWRDRKADLAMTGLLGGPGAGFYAVYREAWPLDSAYAIRKNLSNLHHILNDYNLLGSCCADQTQRMLR